jgi:cell division protein FtsB
MKSIFNFLFESPKRMMIICGIFIFFGLGFSGDLYRLIKITKYEQTLKNRIQSVQVQKKEIKEKIRESSSKEYIEREAFQRFDMTQEGDMIFVFND